MKTQHNGGGGTTIILEPGDRLTDVPRSHLGIATVEIHDAFVDPPRYFDEIARKCLLPSMREYLQKVTSSGRWRLWLADTFMPDRTTFGGFQWIHPQLQTLLLTPGTAIDPRDEFATLYSHLTAMR